MKEGLTELMILLDASGEDQALAAQIIRGYNALIKAQKGLPGQLNVTAVTAGDGMKMLLDARDVASVPALTKRQFAPGGKAYLYDALTEAMEAIGIRLNAAPEEERPERVVVAVVSPAKKDLGLSVSARQAAEAVSHQSGVYSWMFLFVSTGGSVAKRAAAVGIPEQNALRCAADAGGFGAAMEALSGAVAALRAGGVLPEDWKTGVPKAAKKQKAKKAGQGVPLDR